MTFLFRIFLYNLFPILLVSDRKLVLLLFGGGKISIVTHSGRNYIIVNLNLIVTFETLSSFVSHIMNNHLF